MAESKSLTTMQGMWMATLLFVPLGLFLTIKAKNDSAIYNFESYQNFFKRLVKQFKKRAQLVHLHLNAYFRNALRLMVLEQEVL